MNKPKWSKTLICVVISSIICCIGALAVNNRITIDLPDITILVNGEEFIAKDEDGVVVQPILYNGTTYVPLQAIEELNGKFVDWDGDTNTVLINDPIFSDEDVAGAKDTIYQFFESFSKKDYDAMYALTTEGTIQYDYSGVQGVAGMAEATVVSCEYDAENSQQEGRLVFQCTFDMIPAEMSTFGPDQRQTSYFVICKEINGKYYLSDIFSGL